MSTSGTPQSEDLGDLVTDLVTALEVDLAMGDAILDADDALLDAVASAEDGVPVDAVVGEVDRELVALLVGWRSSIGSCTEALPVIVDQLRASSTARPRGESS